jgi:hypothetical protein
MSGVCGVASEANCTVRWSTLAILLTSVPLESTGATGATGADALAGRGETVATVGAGVVRLFVLGAASDDAGVGRGAAGMAAGARVEAAAAGGAVALSAGAGFACTSGTVVAVGTDVGATIDCSGRFCGAWVALRSTCLGVSAGGAGVAGAGAGVIRSEGKAFAGVVGFGVGVGVDLNALLVLLVGAFGFLVALILRGRRAPRGSDVPFADARLADVGATGAAVSTACATDGAKVV